MPKLIMPVKIVNGNLLNKNQLAALLANMDLVPRSSNRLEIKLSIFIVELEVLISMEI